MVRDVEASMGTIRKRNKVNNVLNSPILKLLIFSAYIRRNLEPAVLPMRSVLLVEMVWLLSLVEVNDNIWFRKSIF
jgi:hypothetical protein